LWRSPTLDKVSKPQKVIGYECGSIHRAKEFATVSDSFATLAPLDRR
jgi:hypothetical protein